MSIINGALDTSFGTNGITYTNIPNPDRIKAIAIQTINGINYNVATGTIEGTGSCFVIRYTESGILDTSFGNNGYTTLVFGGATGVTSSITVQEDGKILVGGIAVDSGVQTGFVTRLTSSGLLDNTFGVGGIKYLDIIVGNAFETITKILLQKINNETKILCIGNMSLSSHYTNIIVRLNYNDGSYDTSFGNTTPVQIEGYGSFTPELGTALYFLGDWRVGSKTTGLLLSDNSLIIGALYYDFVNPLDIVLIKYTSNGIIDTTFGVNGIVRTNLNPGPYTPFNIGIQNISGIQKIIISCATGSYNVLARFNLDGTIDTSFGLNSTGIVSDIFGLNHSSGGFSMLIHYSGKIVLAGSVDDNNTGIICFNSDGTLDTTFGTNGLISSSVSDTSYISTNDIMISKNTNGNEYFIIGGERSASNDSFFAKYTTTNQYPVSPTITQPANITKSFGDANFTLSNPVSNSTGSWTFTSADPTSVSISGSFVTILKVTDSNGITITATQAATDNYDIGTTTFKIIVNKAVATGSFTITNKTYTIDTTFTNPTVNSTNVVGGFNWSSSNSSIVSYTNDVASINGPGTVTIIATPINTTNYTGTITSSLTVLPAPPGFNDYLDTSFGSSGVYTQDIQISGVSYNNISNTITRQSDGKLVVAGYSSPVINPTGLDKVITIIRYNVNSNTIDRTFGTNGIFTFPSTLCKHIGKMFILSDDSILIVGQLASTNNHGFIIKLNKNGILDTTFGTNGISTPLSNASPTPLTNISFNCIDVKSDSNGNNINGDIIVGGSDGSFMVIIKINYLGVLDTNFGTYGYHRSQSGTANSALITFSGISLQTQDIKFDLNGDIIACGTTEPNQEQGFIVRLLGTNGWRDNIFSGDGLIIPSGKGGCRNITILSNGKYIVCGHYDLSYNKWFRVERYSSTGVIEAGFNYRPSNVTDYCYCVKNILTSDNKLLSFGIAGTKLLISRHNYFTTNTNPTIDTTFGYNGYIITNVGITINDVLLDNLDTNYVYISTTNSNTTNDFTLYKLSITKESPTIGNFNLPTIDSNLSYTITDPTKPNDHTGTWSYTSSNTNLIQINGNVVTPLVLSDGFVKVTATLSSDSNYVAKSVTSYLYFSNQTTSFVALNKNTVLNEISNNISLVNNKTTITNTLIQSNINVINPSTLSLNEIKYNRQIFVDLLLELYNRSEIIVPKAYINTPSNISSNTSEITILNTKNTTNLSQLIINASDYTGTSLIYCPLLEENNTVKIFGKETYSNYYITITRELEYFTGTTLPYLNYNSIFSVTTTDSNGNSQIQSKLDGDIIEYANIKVTLGSAFIEFIDIFPATGSFTISDKTYLTDTTFTNPTINNTNVVGGFNWSSSNSSIVSYNNNIATINGPGTVTLTATPINSAKYTGSISSTLTVNKAVPTFTQLSDILVEYGSNNVVFNFNDVITTNTDFNKVYTLSSSNENSVSIVNGNELDIKNVTIDTSGNAFPTTITVTLSETTKFLSSSTTFTVTVIRSLPSITPNSFNITSTSYQPNQIITITPPTSQSTGSFTYTSSNPTIAEIINTNQIKVNKAGTVTITAIQAATANYSQIQTTTTFTINKINPVVGGFSIPNKSLSNVTHTITNPTKPLNHTQNWVYTSSDTSKATVSGNVITLLGTGIVKIIATLPTSDIYNGVVIESPFSISAAGTAPSTFNFVENSYITNNTTLNTIQPTNDTIQIINAFVTPDLLNTLNPSSGTQEEKEINRASVVKYLFEVYQNQNQNITNIEVPKELIYLPPDINLAIVERINLFNALLTSEQSPLIINMINYNPNNAVYCLSENNNTVIFNGYGNYNNKSLKIIKIDATNYIISNMIFGFTTSTRNAVKGEIINELGFKYILGSITAQANDTSNSGPICFPKGTPVLTDQGIIEINKLSKNIHTINGIKIEAITKSVPLQEHIICIEKHSLEMNIPSKDTYISMNHKLLYKNKMVKARDLVGKLEGIYKVKYNKEPLYNVLLEKQETMTINNMIVETLDPENIVAKIYKADLNDTDKEIIINKLNKCIKENNINEYNNIYTSLSK